MSDLFRAVTSGRGFFVVLGVYSLALFRLLQSSGCDQNLCQPMGMSLPA